MSGHAVRMLIGCLLPLLLIFVLPLFGVGSGVTLFAFIILMFACHLLMMRGHGKHEYTAEHEEEAGHELH